MTADAYVAEFRRLSSGHTEYRVVLPDSGPLSILYIYTDPDGTVANAETFGGKQLPDVPAAALAAVAAYQTAHSEDPDKGNHHA